jgi:NAD(P)-dependent dehydrogenase (short-subunit alcohol dehydrogenase family)
MSTEDTEHTKSAPIHVEDLFSVKDKVVLVTGGSSGIGLMIARGFVEGGARVYIASRKRAACDAAAAELASLGHCVSLPVDVSKREDRLALVKQLESREGKLHVLVNNAGTNWAAPIEEYPESGFDKVLSVNLEAIFCLTRDCLALLQAAASAASPARVINIGSIDGLTVPFVDNYAYSASKAGVHHLTRVLARRLGPRKITVNAVAPGPFESRMTEWMLDNFQERIESECPLGRIGAPSDMAGIALFLASRAGAYVNGVVIPVDGGIAAR